MAYGTRIAWDAVRELAFGSISGTYAALGTPLADHARLLGLNNSTGVELYVSFDGSTNHLRIASNSFKLFDISTNKVRDDGLFLPVGTQIYVKQVSGAAAAGSIWAEVAYAQGGK